MSDTNMSPTIECGVGPVSRRHALGFRFVADGSDAKIIDVSAYLIRPNSPGPLTDL